LFTLAELEEDLKNQHKIFSKSILLLENNLKSTLDNPSPGNSNQLLFTKSTRKSPLELDISFENKNLIEPIEEGLLDLDEEFKTLRKSKLLIRS
jgi:hypothetical protein